MDSNAEFAKLVSTHRHLLRKYSCPPSGPLCHGNDLSQSENAVWMDAPMEVARQSVNCVSSQVRFCPRCHYNLEPEDMKLDSKDFAPSMQPESLMDYNQVISMQLASMEYARLLSALNSGSRRGPISADDTRPAHTYAVDPFSEAYIESLSRADKKRKERIEKDGQASEPLAAVKRTRLVWTPDLHQRFVDAVNRLGIDKAVPKAILQVMGVDGLTRENVASHLQKYRKQLNEADVAKGNCLSSSNSDKGVFPRSNETTEINSVDSDENNTGDSSTTAVQAKK